MQVFWLYIDDLVGKGLELIDILHLVYYVVLVWVPVALPLALLLSSLITYGNLGETMELVAIKASGVSLLRAFLPIQLFTFLLTGVSFLFSNNIAPYAWLKFNTFRYDVIVAKPALDIKEGIFYDKIDGYVLKLGKKENDSIMKNISIFEQSNPLQDNMIQADSGLMRVSKNKQFIEFVLYNGWRFQERGLVGDINAEFIKMRFKEYRKYFNVSNFQSDKSKEKNFYDPKLLSTRQLIKIVDSMDHDTITTLRVYETSTYFNNFYFKVYDTTEQSLYRKKVPYPHYKIIPDTMLNTCIQATIVKLKSFSESINSHIAAQKNKADFIRFHELELNKKFSLAFTCILLFLIGASLGAIIKKGGFGLPFVFAIICFICFNMLNTTGEKLVKSGAWQPFWGMWFGNLVFTPIAIVLVYKTMNELFVFRWRKKKF